WGGGYGQGGRDRGALEPLLPARGGGNARAPRDDESDGFGGDRHRHGAGTTALHGPGRRGRTVAQALAGAAGTAVGRGILCRAGHRWVSKDETFAGFGDESAGIKFRWRHVGTSRRREEVWTKRVIVRS